MKYKYYILAILNPETCLSCGCASDEEYYSDYHDGQGMLLGSGRRCSKCKTHKIGYAYGSYDDPFWYMDTKWKRFKYLFLNIY